MRARLKGIALLYPLLPLLDCKQKPINVKCHPRSEETSLAYRWLLSVTIFNLCVSSVVEYGFVETVNKATKQFSKKMRGSSREPLFKKCKKIVAGHTFPVYGSGRRNFSCVLQQL